MASAVSRGGKGLWEGLYRVLMRRNSVYVTFVIAGAFAGERAVDYGVHKLWEHNNVGKRNAEVLVKVSLESLGFEKTDEKKSYSVEFARNGGEDLNGAL